MATQKELKEELKNILENEVWKGSPKMVDYCMKKTAYIVELSDGTLIALEKPRIETRFCFGYGYFGISDEKDYENARKLCDLAQNSQEYFINSNLREVDETIEAIKKTDGVFSTMYVGVQYCNCSDECRLKGYVIKRYDQSARDGYSEISFDDKQKVLQGYEIVRESFIKRLNSYLKRYGLSKIVAWTYLCD